MVFVTLVASGIVISISTCLNVWNRATEAAEINQEARAILDMLSRDVQMTYLGLDGKAGYVLGEGPPAGGQPVDTLELATQSSSISRLGLLPEERLPKWDDSERPPVTDYVVVRYEWLAQEGEAPAGLYRTVSVVPTARTEDELELGEPTAYEVSTELVSTAVARLRYEYYDSEGQSWTSSWDTLADRGRALPAISVKLTLRDAGRGGRGKRAQKRDHVFETTIPVGAS